MNFIELTGGLGNQLFQYVFSRYLETGTGQTSALYTNFYDYVKKDPELCDRTFDLDKFNTHYISVNGTVNYRRLVTETGYISDFSDMFIDFFKGYWQDKRYFEAVYEKVREELVLKQEFITDSMTKVANKMSQGESVSLHIRRTDYLSNQNIYIFNSLSPEYYEKALSIISSEYDDNLDLYIFSDDIDHVKENFAFLSNYPCEFMPVREAYQDLHLMSKTRHHIIANSSFSWWAATLSEKREGITIAPAKWYKSSDSPDLYWNDWIVI